jgi:hypothetical protein
MKKALVTTSIGLGTTVLALGALGLATMTAEAYRGEPGVPGPDCSPERQQAMAGAFASNNYQSWKEEMAGKGRVTQVVTEENFGQFARAHERAQAGDLEGAREIRQSLGLGVGQRKGDGSGMGNRYGQTNQHGHQRNN